MGRVIHFEIHADQPERAANFYQTVFGWTVKQWQGGEYWLCTTGPESEPGINGAIMKRTIPVTSDDMIGYVCVLDTKNLDETIKLVTDNGGSITVGKQPVAGVGWVAYFKDTEGNILGAMQNDPNAK